MSFELDGERLARINEYLEDRIGTTGIHPMEDLPDFMVSANSISDAVEHLIDGRKFGARWDGLDLSDEFFSMINGQFISLDESQVPEFLDVKAKIESYDMGFDAILNEIEEAGHEDSEEDDEANY